MLLTLMTWVTITLSSLFKVKGKTTLLGKVWAKSDLVTSLSPVDEGREDGKLFRIEDAKKILRTVLLVNLSLKIK